MKLKTFTYAAALGAMLASYAAQATPVLLNTTPLPGTQPANQGDQTVADWLDSLTPAVNDIGTGADVLVNQGNSAPTGYPTFGANTNPITLPVGDYDYLVLHWGGRGGGFDVAYDLTACPDGSTATFTNPLGVNGLSFYRFYNPNNLTTPPPPRLPDHGSALGLLGVATLGLGLARRRATA